MRFAADSTVNHSFTILERLAALPAPDDSPLVDGNGFLVLRGQNDAEFIRAALLTEFLGLFPEADEQGQSFLAAHAPTEWLRMVVLPAHDDFGAEELLRRAQLAIA